MSTSNFYRGSNNSSIKSPSAGYYGDQEFHDDKSPSESDYMPNIPYYSSSEAPDEYINYNHQQQLQPEQAYYPEDSIYRDEYCSTPYPSTSSTIPYPDKHYRSSGPAVFRPPSSSLYYSYTYPPSRNNPNMLQPPGYNNHHPATPGYGGYPPSTYWYPPHPHRQGFHPSHYSPHHHQSGPYYMGHHEHQMADMLHYSNSGREARNRAEKNRRDKLNGSIQELSTMVPHVAESPRRVDKTAVLRFSAHGLRVHYVFGKTVKKPPAAKPQLSDSLMKLLDSFLITITCHGQIVLISPSVEQHLGHCQTDLFGQNILHITHPDDHAMLKRQLIPTDLDNLFDIQPEDDSGEPRPRTQEEEDEIDKKLREDRRNFTVRLARAGPRSEPTSYEVVKLDGCFRRADSAPRGVKTSTFPSGLQLIRRARGRDDTIPLHSISGNDIVLVAMARVIRAPKMTNRLLEANFFEYKTRHLIDGRIIDCDQRISLVAGYMTDEVNGLSPFTFMHQDDVRWVIVALRQMYDCNSAYGESCYRLLARNGRFVYLRTKGYLEIDKESNKVHSFVCINTLVSESEGRRRVQDMKKKFSIIINTKIPSSSEADVPASENPQQLEKAVMCLIQNLQKSVEDEDTDASTSSRASGKSLHSEKMDVGGNTPTHRHTKTPPLALIPPEPSSVKSSISKSVNVVNITVVKPTRANSSSLSPASKSSPHQPIHHDSENSCDSCATHESSSVGSNTQPNHQPPYPSSHHHPQIRPSVLHRSGSAQQESPLSSLSPSSGAGHQHSITMPIMKDEYESRVPPLPNNNCDCYFEGSPGAGCSNCQRFPSQSSPDSASYQMNRQQSYQPIGHTSVLKRTHDYISDSGDSIDSLEVERASKRRILFMDSQLDRQEPAIPSSTFTELESSLAELDSVTECNTFRVMDPSPADLELDDVLIDDDPLIPLDVLESPQEMLLNIKSEFDAQLPDEPGTSSQVTNELKPR